MSNQNNKSLGLATALSCANHASSQLGQADASGKECKAGQALVDDAPKYPLID